MIDIEKLLARQVETDCSDLHIITDEPPFLRDQNGELNPIENMPIISKDEIEITLRFEREGGSTPPLASDSLI
jgi:Tfp pilus assembly pilus retraction ATPase PilT